jgi:hypothetical protein
MSGRLVAAIIIMPPFASKPSISTSSWLSVCSRSSWPPPRPAPRWRPTASISSMKIMHGLFCLACSNRSRTREAPTPTNISTKSDPEMEKNGTPASPATARASRVLPVPGGPTSRAPLGILAPRRWNFWGDSRNSLISVSSWTASFAPATSAKATLGEFLPNRRALDLPKFFIWLPCLPPRRYLIMRKKSKTIRNKGPRVPSRPSQNPVFCGSV